MPDLPVCAAQSAPLLLSGPVDPAAIDHVLKTCSSVAMISASVPFLGPAFSSHQYFFSIWATSSFCQWIILCNGLSLHDGLSSSSSSSLGFCCLRNSFGDIVFLLFQYFTFTFCFIVNCSFHSDKFAKSYSDTWIQTWIETILCFFFSALGTEQKRVIGEKLMNCPC